MQTNIQKWGNSLGIRIPMKLSQGLGLKAGSAVDITLEKNRLVIRIKEYKLEKMLSRVTSKNLHHEFFNDQPKGEELL